MGGGKAASVNQAPTYRGRAPASPQASAAARGSSKKADTRCEVKLRSVLWRSGARFRKNVKELPGCPDIVFSRVRLAIFCDGDFWHGRNWPERKSKLARGANACYWLAKIERNRMRDLERTAVLEADGWTVLRFWEAEILSDVEAVSRRILDCLKGLTSAP
ncbi:MAG: very short patch repair endonuclease [Candidatus Schekmanbacteria bacterium]|nr:very short patch repair endonuclease [Candidatus Schekmanbacteria bacterium]